MKDNIFLFLMISLAGQCTTMAIFHALEKDEKVRNDGNIIWMLAIGWWLALPVLLFFGIAEICYKISKRFVDWYEKK